MTYQNVHLMDVCMIFHVEECGLHNLQCISTICYDDRVFFSNKFPMRTSERVSERGNERKRANEREREKMRE